MSASANEPATPRRAGRRRWLIGLALVVVGLLAAATGWYMLRSEPLPEPPSIPLSGLDSSVARSLEQARAQVVAEPRSGNAWGRFGMVLGGYGMRPEAIRCFTIAEQLEPDEIRWPYFRGVALQLDGADSEALAPLRRAVELCPRAPDAPRLRLAEALLKQEQHDEAERNFRELLAQNPNHPQARVGLARLALARGDLPAARDALRNTLDNLNCRKAAHQLLAEIAQRQGDGEAARRTLRQAATLPADPVWPDPFQNEIEEMKRDRATRIRQAMNLQRRGKEDEANFLLSQVEGDYPGTYPLMEGRRCLEAKDYPAAEQALREAVRLAPDFAQTHFWLGMALLAQKDAKSAAACFRTAVRLQPRHAAAYERLGECLERLKDREGAIAALRTAADLLPQNAEAHRRLGSLLADAGRDDEAQVHLEQSLSLQPDDARTQGLLKQVRQRQRTKRHP